MLADNTWYMIGISSVYRAELVDYVLTCGCQVAGD